MSHSSLGWFRISWLGVCSIYELDPTLFGLGLAAYLALEIALCSALLLAASLLPVEAIQAVCSLAETSFFFVRYHSNRFSLARVALNGILVYTAKFRTFT